MPVEDTNDKIVKKLKEKIMEGAYVIGEQVVPQVFQKLSLRNGDVITEEVTIRGEITLTVYIYLWV